MARRDGNLRQSIHNTPTTRSRGAATPYVVALRHVPTQRPPPGETLYAKLSTALPQIASLSKPPYFWILSSSRRAQIESTGSASDGFLGQRTPAQATCSCGDPPIWRHHSVPGFRLCYYLRPRLLQHQEQRQANRPGLSTRASAGALAAVAAVNGSAEGTVFGGNKRSRR